MGGYDTGRAWRGVALGGGLTMVVLVSSLGARVSSFPLSGQLRPPRSAGASVLIGGDSLYEGRYGQARFVDLDEEPRPWPQRQALRTEGRLFETDVGRVGRVLEWASPISTHALCGRNYCVALSPAEEVSYPFSGVARSWEGRGVEVIGAIEDLNRDPNRDPVWVFLVWSFTLAEDQGEEGATPPVSELESLVRSPEARAGERISVKGVFRGANLFDDMPPGTRRRPGDWVLRDGPFFIWVTGKRPKGSGFDLDPSSRSDCRWRLEVSGRVEEENGLVYLEAREVRLLGRAPPATAGP